MYYKKYLLDSASCTHLIWPTHPSRITVANQFAEKGPFQNVICSWKSYACKRWIFMLFKWKLQLRIKQLTQADWNWFSSIFSRLIIISSISIVSDDFMQMFFSYDRRAMQIFCNGGSNGNLHSRNKIWL